MDSLERAKAATMKSFNDIKENTYAYYGLILIGIVIFITLIVKQYRKIVAREKAEPIFIRSIKNAYARPIEVSGKEISAPNLGSAFTYSTWLFINDFNKKKRDLKHVFHKGDEGMNTMTPGVFISPEINSLAIVFDTENRVKNTVSTTKYPKKLVKDVKTDVQGVFPMDNPCGCEELLKVNPEYKMASFDKDEDGNGTCYLFDKKKDSVNSQTSISWIKTKSNTHTMNPFENPSILFDDKSCIVIENIPLQRWFHVVIVINQSSVEVYIDGKLHKTLILHSPVKINTLPLFSGLYDGFDGMINELRYFPYSLKYNEVYNMYNRGPTPFYFMNMIPFFKRSELYGKLKSSIDNVLEDAGEIITNLSEDIYGAPVFTD
jgi:hypothetical protein